MAGSKQFLVAIVVALLTVLTVADIRLQQADRKILLQSQFARITEVLKFKNNDNAAVDHVSICTLTELAEKTAYQKVTDITSSSGYIVLPANPIDLPAAPAGVTCYKVVLAAKLPAGEVVTLQVESTVIKAQQPYPAEITQTDTQLVLYLDNVYVISPYTVSSQTTEVLLASNVVKSYTDTEKPTVKSDSKVKYGRYDKVEPFTIKEMRLHYENQKPFRMATTLVREITVSHWGNIYVEETYELKHTGAKHKGPFSRLKYAHAYNGKANSYQDLKARLPASARHLYYVDIIGNISTSNTRRTSSETVLDFKTRYPLMGGWKVDFILGYSVPLTNFLFKKKSDGKYRLSIDFNTPIEDVHVEDLVVKVVLPEGAAGIKAIVPFAVEESFENKYTYLDTTGRPVLVLHKKNVVPEHSVKFSVDYSFSATDMLREPLLLISVIGALFALAIAYNRLELTISKDDNWQQLQGRDKVATIMQQIHLLLEGKSHLLSQLLRLVPGLRDAQDIDAVINDRTTLEKKLRDMEEQIKPLQDQLESSRSLAASVRELQEKFRATQARTTRLIAERIELVKRATPISEINKKLSTSVVQAHDLQRELDEQIATVFAPY